MVSTLLPTISGNLVLSVYDCFVLGFFFLEVWLFVRHRKVITEALDDEPNRLSRLQKFIRRYNNHGLLVIDVVLFFILILGSLVTGTMRPAQILRLTVFLIGFFVAMLLTKKLFFNADAFENGRVVRTIDSIFHLIVGHIFVLTVPAITTPSLPLMLGGLAVALLFCFSIMLQAIIDPNILLHQRRRNCRLQRRCNAKALLKGIGIILVCVLAILYLMVLACWKSNPDYYVAAYGTIDQWDLIYYLFVTFSTIGFGDIVALRPDGLFFARFVAIVISMSGMFTTGCFIGAIISGFHTVTDEPAEPTQENQICRKACPM